MSLVSVLEVESTDLLKELKSEKPESKMASGFGK